MVVKNKLFCGPIYVKKSLIHGYGVFARQAIRADQIIEECHTLPLSECPDDLRNYFFGVNGIFCLPVGYGCIYNHSNTPNAAFEYDTITGIMTFKTTKHIYKNEEICIFYGKEWLASRDLEIKSVPARPHRFGAVLLRGSLLCCLVWGATHGLTFLLAH